MELGNFPYNLVPFDAVIHVPISLSKLNKAHKMKPTVEPAIDTGVVLLLQAGCGCCWAFAAVSVFRVKSFFPDFIYLCIYCKYFEYMTHQSKDCLR